MLAEKNICTGCSACAAGCPANCIEMRADSEGFCYPAIDLSRCISCKKCEIICPVINKSASDIETRAYGVKHKDDYTRSRSSSGGVFPALAAEVLADSGVVCGAAYAEDFSVVHQIIENAADIARLQGAKYAQSSTEHLFGEVKRVLKEDRMVLFSGTPCQVAGLKSFLGKEYDKLITVDMICHGVPSPVVWKKYLAHRTQKDAKISRVIDVNQRDKVTGWSQYRYSLRITYENGKTYCTPQGEEPYMRGFVNNLYLRPSCAQCSFKGSERCSDITLGDYWGVWDHYPEKDDDKGMSLVLTNTPKGHSWLKRIEGDVDIFSADMQKALTQNPSANNSSMPHPKRELFFSRIDDEDIEQLISEMLFGAPENKYSFRNLLRKLFEI